MTGIIPFIRGDVHTWLDLFFCSGRPYGVDCLQTNRLRYFSFVLQCSMIEVDMVFGWQDLRTLKRKEGHVWVCTSFVIFCYCSYERACDFLFASRLTGL